MRFGGVHFVLNDNFNVSGRPVASVFRLEFLRELLVAGPCHRAQRQGQSEDGGKLH
jgi:hypothetical protein